MELEGNIRIQHLQGEPLDHDPDFRGPTKHRSCTDCVFLILFLIGMVAWGLVTVFALQRGDVQNLLSPMDSDGFRCGVDSNVLDKPNLVFFNITHCLSLNTALAGCDTPQVCVSACPQESIIFTSYLSANPSGWAAIVPSLVCKYNVDKSTISSANQILQYISTEQCASYVLRSESILGRCIPDLSTYPCERKKTAPVKQCVDNAEETNKKLKSVTTAIGSYIGIVAASIASHFSQEVEASKVILGRCMPLTLQDDAQILEELGVNNVDQFLSGLNSELGEISALVVEDLIQSRWYIVGGLFGVLFLCIIYIILIRWIVYPLVWASLIGFLALLSFCVYLSYTQYRYYTDHPVLLEQTSNFLGYIRSKFHSPSVWMAILIIALVLFIILFLIVVFLRKRISIAVALIKEGSKAVTAVKTTILFPIFPWIFQCGAIGLFLVIICYLMSVGKNIYQVVNMEGCTCNGYEIRQLCTPENFTCVGTCTDAACHYIGVEQPNYTIYLHLYNAFAFFWFMFFIHGVSDMILANTFARWYWTFHKKNLSFFTLTKGIWTVLRYHLGTVALGSLLLAIVRVIRLILEYIDSKLKKYDNAFTKCLMCFCKCFLYCLENFIKFINKNAYIMCAIHGKGFCTSARDAFSLLMRNILRVVVLDKVTDFIFLLSRAALSIGIGFAVYYFQQWQWIYNTFDAPKLSYPEVPAVILGIAAFLISSICFNVYAVAVDTLFLCFLEDSERNNGSVEKPYYMSKNLRKILGKRNKIPKQD